MILILFDNVNYTDNFFFTDPNLLILNEYKSFLHISANYLLYR